MYFRRLRTLVNDLLATGRMEALYDAKVGIAQPEIALDFARWVYDETESYTTQRNRLVQGHRGTADGVRHSTRGSRATSPPSPNIVIDEIQHSPTGGDTAEFVELYNPGTQAIDLSGWTIAGGIDLTIQPGTVILPQSTMTFVSNDPAFRAAYGATVFVGDRYTGNLAPSAPLTLTRPDGTTADTAHLRRRRLARPHRRSVPRAHRPRRRQQRRHQLGPVHRLRHPRHRHRRRRHHRTRRTHHRHRHRRQRHRHRHAGPHPPTTAAPPSPATRSASSTTPAPRSAPCAPPAPAPPASPSPASPTAPPTDFQVAATNSAGTGPYSALSNAVTPRRPRVPGPRSSGPQPGRRRRSTHRHRPLDPAHQHRRLGHHRLPGHRTADELRRSRRHRPVHHHLTRPRAPASGNARSPSPPATTASRSSPSTPSAPAPPQPAPPTSSPAENRPTRSLISRMKAKDFRPNVDESARPRAAAGV